MERPSGRVYVDNWGVAYGTSYRAQDDDDSEQVGAEIVEDRGAFAFHDGVAAPPTRALAFTDGVRRGEAYLYREGPHGESIRGLAGAIACGAVLTNSKSSPAYNHMTVHRLVIWASPQPIALAAPAGGWSWEPRSCEDTDPAAPLDALQRTMQASEAALAQTVAEEGYIVFVDGPLRGAFVHGDRVIGHVKTHHRTFLALDNHRAVTNLKIAQRTSLFRIERSHQALYSCYLRLADGGRIAGPWCGIVRLEFAHSAGLATAIALADMAAGNLPRYAGVPHRDPRAPQNLQPVGALEARLRHLLGDEGLAARAVRAAVASIDGGPSGK
jgi:hypothetical protein